MIFLYAIASHSKTAIPSHTSTKVKNAVVLADSHIYEFTHSPKDIFRVILNLLALKYFQDFVFKCDAMGPLDAAAPADLDYDPTPV